MCIERSPVPECSSAVQSTEGRLCIDKEPQNEIVIIEGVRINLHETTLTAEIFKHDFNLLIEVFQGIEQRLDMNTALHSVGTMFVINLLVNYSEKRNSQSDNFARYISLLKILALVHDIGKAEMLEVIKSTRQIKPLGILNSQFIPLQKKYNSLLKSVSPGEVMSKLAGEIVSQHNNLRFLTDLQKKIVDIFIEFRRGSNLTVENITEKINEAINLNQNDAKVSIDLSFLAKELLILDQLDIDRMHKLIRTHPVRGFEIILKSLSGKTISAVSFAYIIATVLGHHPYPEQEVINDYTKPLLENMPRDEAQKLKELINYERLFARLVDTFDALFLNQRQYRVPVRRDLADLSKEFSKEQMAADFPDKIIQLMDRFIAQLKSDPSKSQEILTKYDGLMTEVSQLLNSQPYISVLVDITTLLTDSNFMIKLFGPEFQN